MCNLEPLDGAVIDACEGVLFFGGLLSGTHVFYP